MRDYQFLLRFIHIAVITLSLTLAACGSGGGGGEQPSAAGYRFFWGDDGTGGTQLWKSDGTEAGTVPVKKIGTGFPFDQEFTLMGNYVYFAANDGTGLELWRSNGTDAGTTMVKRIGPTNIGSYPRYLTTMGGILYFSASDGSNGYELWRSDGTATGTEMFQNINGSGSSFPMYLTNVNGTLYFAANDGTNGVELWMSEGTAGGAARVKDINTSGDGIQTTHNAPFCAIGSTLYFVAATDGTNFEVWKSDGTADGTSQLVDINGLATSSSPDYLANLNGTLYLAAFDNTGDKELWQVNVSNGNKTKINMDPSIGSEPSELVSFNDVLYFRATTMTDPNQKGTELWKYDGSSADIVKDIQTGLPSGYPAWLSTLGGFFSFSAHDGTNGRELWTSDGTFGGTVMIKDVDGSSGNGYVDLSN